MRDFGDVEATSKDEQIRAYSVEKALEFWLSSSSPTHVETLIFTADKIENYIKKGHR